MSSFWRALGHRALLLSTLVTGACADNGAGGRVPVLVDWALDGSQPSLVVPFEVTEHRMYAIQLRYPFQEGDREGRALLWERVGGGRENPLTRDWEKPGAPVTVHLQVWRQAADGGRELMMESRIVNPKLSSWGAGQLNAELLRLDLSPGRYAVQASTAQAAPALAGVAVKLAVTRAYVGK